MGNAIKWGLILAVSVTVVSVLMILTGQHANPYVGGFLALAIYVLLNIVVVILALRQTRSENGYGRQLLQALLLGVAGGVAIFVLSYLMMAVVFPDALDQTKDGFAAMIEAAGLPQDQVDLQVAKIEQMTPVGEAVKGLIGTTITSLIVGAIAAIFLRRK